MIPFYILAIEDESDRAFMSELFLEYHRLMYHEIFEIVHDPWLAEDLMQATLEKLIDKVHDLRIKDRCHLVNYIITACKNQARNHLRSQARHPSFQFDESWDCSDIEHSQEAMEHRLVLAEEADTLARIWAQLDERSRWILEGRYIQERSPAEMAQELGIKTESFRMALARARKNAYALLSSELNEER